MIVTFFEMQMWRLRTDSGGVVVITCLIYPPGEFLPTPYTGTTIRSIIIVVGI
jgi:hypothetical protein